MAYHNYNDCICIGILAGMRPCGVIVLLSKLFTTQSKTQVYGCLHNYYSHHPTIASKIGALNVQSCPMIISVTQHSHITLMMMHAISNDLQGTLCEKI